jgi:fatty acid synthase subunit beta, fungi type
MGHVLTTLSRSSPSAFSHESLLSIVRAQTALSHDLAMPIELERGAATIPLRGIDVPFHSTHLRHGIEPYRRYLETKILEENVDLENLVGKFIPNVLAKPFSVEKEYVEEAARTMDSKKLRGVLENWVEV